MFPPVEFDQDAGRLSLNNYGPPNRRESYDRRGHKCWNDSPGNMVDSYGINVLAPFPRPMSMILAVLAIIAGILLLIGR